MTLRGERDSLNGLMYRKLPRFLLGIINRGFRRILDFTIFEFLKPA